MQLTGDIVLDEEKINNNCSNSRFVKNGYKVPRDTTVGLLAENAGLRDRGQNAKSYITEYREDMKGTGFRPLRPARLMESTNMWNSFKNSDGTTIGLFPPVESYKVNMDTNNQITGFIKIDKSQITDNGVIPYNAMDMV